MTISTTTPDQPEEREPRVFTPAESEVVFQSPFANPPATFANPPATRRRPGGLSAVSLLLALAGVIAIAGVAFAVGRTTAGTGGTSLPAGAGADIGNNGSVPNFAVPGGRDDNGGGDDANRINESRSITGTVTSVRGDTLTVQVAGGRTVQVAVDASTTYHAQVPAAQGTVTPGTRVTVSVSGFGPPGTGTTSGLTAGDVTIAGG
jgi:hypothetical protein